MKAGQLKRWLMQMNDNEEVIITSMDDKFSCSDFCLHSLYEIGEQAQEIILPYYFTEYTKEE